MGGFGDGHRISPYHVSAVGTEQEDQTSLELVDDLDYAIEVHLQGRGNVLRWHRFGEAGQVPDHEVMDPSLLVVEPPRTRWVLLVSDFIAHRKNVSGMGAM